MNSLSSPLPDAVIEKQRGLQRDLFVIWARANVNLTPRRRFRSGFILKVWDMQ
jgi:hypothetical protein